MLAFVRSGVRPTAGAALVLGASSMVLGLGAAMLVAYGLTLNVSESRASVPTLAYELTQPLALAWLVGFASPAVLTGGLGLWLSRRGGRAAGRTSAAATAARFSLVGLGSAGLIVALAVVAAVSRRVIWG